MDFLLSSPRQMKDEEEMGLWLGCGGSRLGLCFGGLLGVVVVKKGFQFVRVVGGNGGGCGFGSGGSCGFGFVGLFLNCVEIQAIQLLVGSVLSLTLYEFTSSVTNEGRGLALYEFTSSVTIEGRGSQPARPSMDERVEEKNGGNEGTNVLNTRSQL
nr:hypothetical protein CFP56_51126 [Quercus suber]